ncbi:MAG: PPC domain-containing protein, partial [Planctomycetaceae bacterium]|nr:PPC domain-containing protein [Planctomycetaceae bacterium]
LLTLPCGITGVLDERFGEDRYRIAGKQGERWSITVSTDVTALPVDAVLSLYDPEGKQLNRVDDHADSTDAEMEFTVPMDGEYTIGVSDAGSHSGSRAATYNLSVRPVEPDYVLNIPVLLNAPVGSKSTLTVSVTRRGGFADAIDLMLTGLPAGVTAPETMQIPANQNAFNVELNVAPDAAASGALVSVTANATIAGHPVGRTAGPVLIATTIKPPFSIDAEGQDDVTKWPRGTTFPAPVLISREAGFDGEIVLEMTSKQGRHRQGISGPDLIVPPGVSRILYPVYLPEWLETTRTSRMVVNGVAKVIDPQGNARYSVSRQKTRMGFLPTGALLKISPATVEFRAMPGEQIRVPIIIDRSEKLTESLTLELCCSEAQQAIFAAAHQTLTDNVPQTEMSIAIAATAASGSEHILKLRATLLKDGVWPVISETSVLVELP